jgi:hypothetical protein
MSAVDTTLELTPKTFNDVRVHTSFDVFVLGMIDEGVVEITLYS